MVETHSVAPGSSPYNKARKQYLKSNRSKPSSSSSKNWTPFRAAEKKYMTKYPPPDLSEVLDLALVDEQRKEEVDRCRWKGRPDAIEIREISLKGEADKGERKAYCVPHVPGLVILPGYLTHETQRRLVRWSIGEHARKPNETNLDAHYNIPIEGLWSMHIRNDKTIIPRCDNDSVSVKLPAKDSVETSNVKPQIPNDLTQTGQTGGVKHSEPSKSFRPTTPSAQSIVTHGSATASNLLPKLRWANIGWFYNWGTKEYEFDRGKPDVGEPVESICKGIVASIDWKAVFYADRHDSLEHCAQPEIDVDWQSWDTSYAPDAGIVNFYQYKDTLMGHVDRAEVCATSPLVSLSLGNAAVFLIGGSTKNDEPVALLLRSGDAVVMAGPGCRRAYHGIPRVLEGSVPAHFDVDAETSADWEAYSQYLQITRINVNVRQVFPKDYDPRQSKWTCTLWSIKMRCHCVMHPYCTLGPTRAKQDIPLVSV